MFEFDWNFKKIMAGLENLNKRLQYQGGNAEDRFIEDKLKTLKKALLYSYQAETIVLSDGREFRCLINKNKLSEDYHDRIISIPFYDICLNKNRVGTTSEGEELIGLKPGDVFTWKGKNHTPDTYWIVYLRYIEENAYFRADIRECNAEVEINGNRYRAYTRGPAENDLKWNQASGISWNDLNYSLVMYISKNEETLNYFHRFTKVKIDGNTWEVGAVNPYYANGIIKVCLNESFNNEMDETVDASKPELPPIQEGVPYITGALEVKPYDIVHYNINNESGGKWLVSNSKKAKIIESTELSATVEIITGRSGDFDLIYQKDGINILTMPIVIKSL